MEPNQPDKSPAPENKTEPKPVPSLGSIPTINDLAVAEQAKILSSMPLEEIDPTIGMPLSSTPRKSNKVGLTMALVIILVIAVILTLVVSHKKDTNKTQTTSSSTNATGSK